jgi:polyhydroxyalkanoate synthase
MRAQGDKSVASLTLLTTMLDFAEAGDLGVFIDEQGVSQREQSIGKEGIYPGKELGFVFQTLRANDLIWPYVVSNYLKGKSPEAFDLLYWNADGTNLPGPMYAWYLRNMYLENNLCVPNRLTMCGTRVDLGRIDMPCYVLATQEDHIVPWRAAYRSTQLVGGRTQFVLGASGHIAGVINPASKNKRSYWIDGALGDDPEQWLASAQSVPGSWWTHWMKWLKPQSGKQIPARRRLGNAKHKPIEAAPGRYVKARAD